MGMDEDDGLATLTQWLIGRMTLAETLTQVLSLANTALSADMTGITMPVEGKIATAVFTDPEAVEIDAHQYTGDSGPCVEAFRRGQIVVIDVVADDPRWPEFAEVASGHGVASTLSLPLSAGGSTLGALNLYSRRSRMFGPAQRQAGLAFADQAAVVLSNTRIHHDAQELNENLSQALTSRATIDIAVGVIVAGGGRTPEQAFGLLVRASQRENRKLRTIAEEIVQRAQSRPGGPGAPGPDDDLLSAG